MRRLGVAAVLLWVLAGCSDDPAPEQAAEPAPTVADLPEGCPAPLAEMDRELDEELRAELVAMFERDQAGRTGGRDNEGDDARTARLKEIIAEHGWPGTDLVGDDGEDAAWTIAQHSDLDPDFQRCALAHLEVAVEQGVGSPGNLAYLTDRVAAGAGEPQTYGTQMGCTKKGPKPATPLVDPDRVEELRAEAGLESYEDYLAEMAEVCRTP
ncbi:MAG TPA: DUF6624 domain-containing protein [Acidimicrobiales bacterium]